MRARVIWPEFFDDADLCALPIGARMLFAGLWCLADREGRLHDNPVLIVAQVFPHDLRRAQGQALGYAQGKPKADLRQNMGLDFIAEAANWLDSLADLGFIKRYTADGQDIIQIPNFLKYQRPHVREKSSTLPPPQGKPKAIPKATPKAMPKADLGLSPRSLISVSVYSDSSSPPTPPPAEGGGTGDEPTEAPFDAEAEIEAIATLIPNPSALAAGKRLLAQQAVQSTDPQRFLADVRRWVEAMLWTRQWRRDGGRYAPTLLTICRETRYLDPLPEGAGPPARAEPNGSEPATWPTAAEVLKERPDVSG